MDIIKKIAQEIGCRDSQVEAAVKLIDESNTIPFIARYRKEATGSLNDEQLRLLHERLVYLRNLEDKKAQVIASIEEQGKLTDQLRADIEKAETMVLVDDLYRPYRPKRKTRATIAKGKGLEGLANIIMLQMTRTPIAKEAEAYVSEEKGVADTSEAIAGAMDIIAENISDTADYRTHIRDLTTRHGVLRTTAKDPEAESVYEMYYDFSTPVSKMTGYRTLAVNRGEKEKFITVKIEAPVNDIISYLKKQIIVRDNPETEQILSDAIADSYDRLIAPAIEREIRNALTETAEDGAIKVFASNLQQLLMQPPIAGQTVLGWDPAFRTGCKLAVVDPTGKVLDTVVIFPTAPQKKVAEAKNTVNALIKKYGITLISVGNGTASRESEMVIAELISELDTPVQYVITNEAGASVYSASKLATEEFPHFDVGQRSAASIARRVQDPLAELVKIDPKAIGVGQYQHDVDQTQLKKSLDTVVMSCVNSVGVNLNTASQHLLTYVSGLGPTLAKNIVEYRRENGAFASRAQLKKVPRLGPSAFEQCAGFLRIPGAKNPLDNSAVHPERYALVETMAKDQGVTVKQLVEDKALQKKIDVKKYVTAEVGMPTLTDIMAELDKPGLDPRGEVGKFEFDASIKTMEDLQVGMVVPGIVTNITKFGAFVDIGVHQDGLVHVSQMSNRYINDPSEVVKLHEHVMVRVAEVDLKRKRIALSMKGVK